MKIVLCGYYGHGNFGDEAILRVILSKIKKQNPTAKICVLKAKNIFSATRDMVGADFFIFGGGSILQNSTSDASLLCYLAIIHLSTLFCKRKIMLANGIGPIIERKIPRKILIRAIARAVNCFDDISVRDTESQKFLQALLPHRKIHLVPDPALISFFDVNRKLSALPKASIKKDFFVYIPRAYSVTKSQITVDQLAKSLKSLSLRYGARIKIVVLNKNEDLSLALGIAMQVDGVEIAVPQNEQEAANILQGAKFVISSRYHGSILAAVLGIPTMSISIDPKIRALCTSFGLFPASMHEIFKNSALLNAEIDKMLDFHAQNADKISKSVQKFSAEAEKSLDEIFKNFCFYS